MDALNEFRKMKDLFFKQDPHSPLTEGQKEVFQGLDYYPENGDLRFVTRAEPFSEQKEVLIHTSTGDQGKYIRYGRLKFEVDGQPAELTLYLDSRGQAFLPFADQTCGGETYGAGRYLEPDDLGEDMFLVDFNLAYNPWCAYSPLYSCPLPPEENKLSVPIRAGERNYPAQDPTSP